MPDSPVYVLVVEDDFLSRLHAVSLVQDAGYIAVEASDADEAITILQTSICRGRWTALNLLMPFVSVGPQLS
jgi:CheY-like chemotaxis protein